MIIFALASKIWICRRAICKNLIFALLLITSVEAQQSSEVRVGAILSLSGGLEQWGHYYQRGIELALSEEGPVRARVFFEDDRSLDSKAALTAGQKLARLDAVDVIFNWSGSTTSVLSRVALDAQVPVIIGAFDATVSRSGPFVFGSLVNYELVSREAARYFARRGHRRFGMIIATDVWSQNYSQPFSDEVRSSGGTVVLSETVSPSETDTRALILMLKKAKVEVVLAPLYGSSLLSFLKTARELKFTGEIYVGDGMFEEDIKVAGGSAQGVYASQLWVENPTLSSKYMQRFGKSTNPLQLGLVASGYDVIAHIRAVAQSLVSAGIKISGVSLSDALRRFSSKGYLGNHMFGAPPTSSGEVIVIVRDGRYVPADDTDKPASAYAGGDKAS